MFVNGEEERMRRCKLGFHNWAKRKKLIKQDLSKKAQANTHKGVEKSHRLSKLEIGARQKFSVAREEERRLLGFFVLLSFFLGFLDMECKVLDSAVFRGLPWEEYSVIAATETLRIEYTASYYISSANLRCYFPGVIDIYFDTACGMISQVTGSHTEGLQNFDVYVWELGGHGRLHSCRSLPPLSEVVRISYVQDIAEGLDNAPAGLVGLFSGRNIGKQLVMVSRE